MIQEEGEGGVGLLFPSYFLLSLMGDFVYFVIFFALLFWGFCRFASFYVLFLGLGKGFHRPADIFLIYMEQGKTHNDVNVGFGSLVEKIPCRLHVIFTSVRRLEHKN